MKTYISKKLIGSVALSLVMAGLAQAQTVSGAVNADNRFMVTLQQGTGAGSNTIVHTAPSNYSWGQTNRFSFNIKEGTDLKQCRVNIIAWGDGKVAEGLAGVLYGDNGSVYTGNGFSANHTSVNANGFGGVPSLGTVDSITPASGGVSNTGLASGHQTWGNVANNYTSSDFGGTAVPQDFSWIKPSNMSSISSKNYMVFSAPCAELVNPAVHMPGEHFQCYNLEKGDRLKPEEITIRDQFGKSQVVLGTPRMLCNPSAKTHGRKTYEIENKERHLVCYDYEKQEDVKPQNLRINNQFAPDDVVSTRRQMFCVPSSKAHTDRIGGDKETRYERNRPARPAPRIQRR